MKLIITPALLGLLPIAFSLPTTSTPRSIPELSVSEWVQVQSGFQAGAKALTEWSWSKAEHLFDIVEGVKGDESKTIWQTLKEDPNSFSKLVKIIEFEKTAIKYLDDKDAQITFFAPNNDALTPPKHHHHDDDDDDDVAFHELINAPSLSTLSAALDRQSYLVSSDDDDDDEKKKHRKEVFRHIAGKVLQYHGLTKAYTAQELAQNNTFATALKAEDGSFAGLHRRIRVEKQLVPPGIKLNFYAKVLVSDIKARNGYLHTLDHPLLPPPSILEGLFLFPDEFSTLTSAIQKVHGNKYLDYSYDHEHSKPGKPKFHGAGLVTIFAPTNKAWSEIPEKLKIFLFSPFGEKVLAKLLAYHVVPHTLLLSEVYYHEKHDDHKDPFNEQIEAIEFFNDPSFHKELEVNSALPNSTLKVVIDKKQIVPIEGAVKTTISVNGDEVRIIDGPARNGAVHVIDKILVPPHHHHHHDDDHHDKEFVFTSWSNWEHWLPVWADQE